MIIYIRFLHLEIIDFRMDIERFTNKIDTYNSYNMDFLANTAKLMYDALNNLKTNQKDINERLDYVDNLSRRLSIEIDRYNPLKLNNAEQIKQSVILLINKTASTMASGVIIEIKGIRYVLTVAHIIDKDTDDVVLIDDNKIEYDIILVKINKNCDLALFKIIDNCNLPFLDMSDIDVREGDNVFVVGNADGLIDVITAGVVAQKRDKLLLLTNKIWFGCSGAPVIYSNKIVGIIMAIDTLYRPPLVMSYAAAINLKTIKKFLEDYYDQKRVN